jgi:hypothetical protein
LGPGCAHGAACPGRCRRVPVRRSELHTVSHRGSPARHGFQPTASPAHDRPRLTPGVGLLR